MVDQKAKWKYRRRYLIWVTAFSMTLMVFSVAWRSEASVARTVVEMGFLALMAFVGSYVFGAVWDDKKGKGDVDVSPGGD